MLAQLVFGALQAELGVSGRFLFAAERTEDLLQQDRRLAIVGIQFDRADEQFDRLLWLAFLYPLAGIE